MGVVHRVQTDAADPQRLPEIFLPYAQFPGGRGIFAGAFADRSGRSTPSVRRVVQSLDPGLPLYNVRPLSEVLDENLAPRRLMVMLLSSFAGIALLLAGLGVYGVMAYMITGRHARNWIAARSRRERARYCEAGSSPRCCRWS